MMPRGRLLEESLNSGRGTPHPRLDEGIFRQRVLLSMLAQAEATPTAQQVFFDYALPDNLAFYRHVGVPVSEDVSRAARRYRYAQVFLLSPLPLNPDPLRIEDETAQSRLYKLIYETYSDLVSCSVNRWHMYCIGFRYLLHWRYRDADGTAEG